MALLDKTNDNSTAIYVKYYPAAGPYKAIVIYSPVANFETSGWSIFEMCTPRHRVHYTPLKVTVHARQFWTELSIGGCTSPSLSSSAHASFVHSSEA